MLTLSLPDLKQTTSQLFVQDSFDYFLVNEITITTFNTFTIDGHLHPDFYNTDELAALKDSKLSAWGTLRPICFSLIKGHKLPLQFQLIFSLSSSNINKFLHQYHLENFTDSINGLYLNIRYEHKELSLTTATSLTTFTLDRSIENAWDDTVQKLLKQLNLLSVPR